MPANLPDHGYVVEKGGYFYRPCARGYTGVLEEAGRYSLEDARSHATIPGVSFQHETEVSSAYSWAMCDGDIRRHNLVVTDNRDRRLTAAFEEEISGAEYTALVSEEFNAALWEVFEVDGAHPLALAHAAELVGREIRDEEMRSLSASIQSMAIIGCSPKTMDRLREELDARVEAARDLEPAPMSP